MLTSDGFVLKGGREVTKQAQALRWCERERRECRHPCRYSPLLRVIEAIVLVSRVIGLGLGLGFRLGFRLELGVRVRQAT